MTEEPINYYQDGDSLVQVLSRASAHNIVGRNLCVMLIIHYHGARMVGDFIDQLHVSGASITGVLDRLEARALTTRRINPEDRRSLLVDLTAKGADMIHHILTGEGDGAP